MQELIRFIRYRTLCVACGIFLLVLGVGCRLPREFLPILTIAAALGFAAAVVYAIVRRNVYATHPAVIAATALLAAIVGQVYFGGHIARVEALSGEVCRVRAEVIEPTYTTVYLTTYDINVKEVNGEKLSFKAELTTDYVSGFAGGDILLFDGEFSDFSSNIAGFDEKSYNFSKGIFLAVEATSDVKVVGEALLNPLYLAVYVNMTLDSIIQYYVDDSDAAGYISGLFLGNGQKVSPSLKRDFRTLGLMHILALSGMHLVVLTTILDTILLVFRVRKQVRIGASMVFVVLYMLISGMSPSIVRSSLMLMISSTMQLFREQDDGITSLFMATAIICAVSPNSVVDVGLMLSFSATLGLLTLGHKTDEILWKLFPRRKDNVLYTKLRRLVVKFLSAVGLSFAALFFTFPIIAIYFGEFSLMGVIMTPIMSPIQNLILLISPLIIMTSFIPPIASTLGHLATVLYYLTELIATSNADPGMLISLRYGFVKYVAVGFFVMLILLLLMKLKFRWSLLASEISAAVVFFVCLVWYNAVTYDMTLAAYVNYRQNDMLVLNSASNTLICDISQGTLRPTREADYIVRSRFHTREIDVYMLTHYHSSHTGTFALLADTAYVRCLLLPYPLNDEDRVVAHELETDAKIRDIDVRYYTYGEDFKFGNAVLIVDAMQTLNLSHQTIALSVTDGDKRLVYSGASAYGSEVYDAVTSDDAASSLLILGTHGPKENCGIVGENTESITMVVTVSDREFAPVAFDGAEHMILEQTDKLASAVYKIE